MTIAEVQEADRRKRVAQMDFWPAVDVTFAEYQAQRKPRPGLYQCPVCGYRYNPTWGKACPSCGSGGREYADVLPDYQREDWVGA